MTTPIKSEEAMLDGILYAALGAPIGLLLRSSEPQRAINKLRQRVERIKDVELLKLQIALSPLPDGDIIIVKIIEENEE